ncbi:MAG TPA: PTS transporter subunit EIIB [Acholeplasmataceae bacterium]|jgi:glucose-like phosphotransferase system IIB component|nr:PTS transporter subunit EIIB [Acholeplasmataceae bacterium]
MIFAITVDDWTLIILAICVLPIMALIVYALVMTLIKKRQQAEVRAKEIAATEDDTQKELFLRLYGGADNIESVSRELSRISVRVKDIDKVLVEELKETGAKGILLVNDIVKCNFGDRAAYIFRLLDKETE